METFRIRVNESGRILIPSEIRKAMKINAGDELTLTYSDSDLKIETRRQVMERAREALRMDLPKGVSMLEELFKERREDAKKEELGN